MIIQEARAIIQEKFNLRFHWRLTALVLLFSLANSCDEQLYRDATPANCGTSYKLL